MSSKSSNLSTEAFWIAFLSLIISTIAAYFSYKNNSIYYEEIKLTHRPYVAAYFEYTIISNQRVPLGDQIALKIINSPAVLQKQLLELYALDKNSTRHDIFRFESDKIELLYPIGIADKGYNIPGKKIDEIKLLQQLKGGPIYTELFIQYKSLNSEKEFYVKVKWILDANVLNWNVEGMDGN